LEKASAAAKAADSERAGDLMVLKAVLRVAIEECAAICLKQNYGQMTDW
jgi:hypothetical protein